MTTAHPPRIYIAGPMNPRNGGGAIEYLANCRHMRIIEAEVGHGTLFNE